MPEPTFSDRLAVIGVETYVEVRIVAPVFVLALALLQNAAPPPLLTDPDAYAVYAVVIAKESPALNLRTKRLVIQEATTVFRDCLPTGEGLKAAPWNEVMDDFARQNVTTRTLIAAFPLDRPYDLVREADITAPFKDRKADGWKAFYKAHPDSGGYLMMSAVGFDAAKTRSVFYLGHSCGWLCGGGTFHFLEKEDGRWHEVAPKNVNICFWVS